MNYKLFKKVFAGKKVIYAFEKKRLFLAAPQMVISIPSTSCILPAELRDFAKPAEPGEIQEMIRKQDASFKTYGLDIAYETGLTFSTTGLVRNFAILLGTDSNNQDYAVYVRKEYLRILGTECNFLGIAGSRKVIFAGADRGGGDHNAYLAYILPSDMGDVHESNLQHIAEAILNQNNPQALSTEQ